MGLRAGLRRDLWTAVAPDIGELRAAHRARATGSSRPPTGLTDDQRGAFLAEALARAERAPTRTIPPPATFRIIASPLVTWIWLGALIVFGGGLDRAVARGRRRRAVPPTAAGLARVARELGRA